MMWSLVLNKLSVFTFLGYDQQGAIKSEYLKGVNVSLRHHSLCGSNREGR